MAKDLYFVYHVGLYSTLQTSDLSAATPEVIHRESSRLHSYHTSRDQRGTQVGIQPREAFLLRPVTARGVGALQRKTKIEQLPLTNANTSCTAEYTAEEICMQRVYCTSLTRSHGGVTFLMPTPHIVSLIRSSMHRPFGGAQYPWLTTHPTIEIENALPTVSKVPLELGTQACSRPAYTWKLGDMGPPIPAKLDIALDSSYHTRWHVIVH